MLIYSSLYNAIIKYNFLKNLALLEFTLSFSQSSHPDGLGFPAKPPQLRQHTHKREVVQGWEESLELPSPVPSFS